MNIFGGIMLSVILTLLFPLIIYAVSAFYLSVYFADKAKAEKKTDNEKGGKTKPPQKSVADSKNKSAKKLSAQPFKTLVVIFFAEIAFFFMLTE